MKMCISCKRTLPNENFCKNKRNKDGLNSKCKDCVKEYRLTIMDKIKAGRKLYREKNRDKINDWRRFNYQEIKDYKHTHYEERSRQMNELKTNCVKCGESRKYLIEFHHRNPKNKSFNVCNAKTYSDKTLQNEIDKCVCLCANCHKEFHYIYGNNPENPEQTLDEYLNLSGKRIVELLTKL